MRSSRPRAKAFAELPHPAIEAVLQEILGSEVDVPTGFGWVRMHCPFHEDRTASASVNHDPDEGGFKCYSCHRKGDAIKMLQVELGLDFKEAVGRAKRLAGGSTTNKTVRKRRPSDLLGK